MSERHIFNASTDMNERAKRLGINVEVNIDLTDEHQPNAVEHIALQSALAAAHEVILRILESAGFREPPTGEAGEGNHSVR